MRKLLFGTAALAAFSIAGQAHAILGHFPSLLSKNTTGIADWWLQARLPTWAPRLVTAAWKVALVLAIVYCAFEPAAEFKYTRI